MTKIYTMAGTPGAIFPVEWDEICHQKEPMLLISHDRVRTPSRWKQVERKRQFAVVQRTPYFGGFISNRVGHYGTLVAAIRAARKYAAKEKA